MEIFFVYCSPDWKCEKEGERAGKKLSDCLDILTIMVQFHWGSLFPRIVSIHGARIQA